MATHNHRQWIEHLRGVAGPVLERWRETRPALGAGPLDGPFLAAVSGAAVDNMSASPAGDPGAIEIEMWRALAIPDRDVEAVLRRCAATGPLLPRDDYQAIEVWTDAELCALHALSALAQQRGERNWEHRVEDARAWHVAHTQPDNATNRPWALHVFLLAGTPETTHYAETLLHNAMAMRGEPEPLSAWILVHAAACIAGRGQGSGIRG